MPYRHLALAAAIVLAAGVALAQAASDEEKQTTPTPTASPAPKGATAGKSVTPTSPGPALRRPPDADREDRDEHRGRTRTPTIFRDATEEEIKDILAFLGEFVPWLQTDLEKMRQSDPERFRQTCRHLRFEVAQMRSLQQRDPEAFRKAIEERQLRMRSVDLAAKARATTDAAEKASIVEELRKVLDRQFSVETVTREAQLRGLEERLESLRREIADRESHRQEIVQKRLDDMLSGKTDSPPGVLPEREKSKEFKDPKEFRDPKDSKPKNSKERP